VWLDHLLSRESISSYVSRSAEAQPKGKKGESLEADALNQGKKLDNKKKRITVLSLFSG
jgi:hypothetical protein